MPQDILDLIAGQSILSRRGGQKPATLAFDFQRSLTPEDLPLILNPPSTEGYAAIPSRKTLRHSHHFLARLLAEGKSPQECMAVTGYGQSTISILQKDPAFKELIDYYRAQTQELYLDAHARLARLGTDAVEVIQERLSEQSEEMSLAQLIKIGEFALDRSIAPSKGAPQGNANGQQTPSIVVNFVTPQSPNGPTGPIIDISPEPEKG